MQPVQPTMAAGWVAVKHSLGPRAASSPGTSLQNPPEERCPRVPTALPEGRAPLARPPPPFPTSYPRQAVTSLRTETRASTLEPLTTAPAAGDSALWAVKRSMLSGRIQLIGRVTRRWGFQCRNQESPKTVRTNWWPSPWKLLLLQRLRCMWGGTPQRGVMGLFRTLHPFLYILNFLQRPRISFIVTENWTGGGGEQAIS